MPNTYGPTMRIFTKTSKVPFGHLRSQGYNPVVYVDDFHISKEICINLVLLTY